MNSNSILGNLPLESAIVTDKDLANALSNTVTKPELNSAISDFITNDDLSDALSNLFDKSKDNAVSGDTSFLKKVEIDEDLNVLQNLNIFGNATIDGTFSGGEGSLASGENSFAFGNCASAVGDYSFAEGHGTVASDKCSHAEGFNTVAFGLYSHAENRQTSAIGNYSHAEGSKTFAYGEKSHAENGSVSAIGVCSHAEGDMTQALYLGAHAEGKTTHAYMYAHAEGSETLAGYDLDIASAYWQGDIASHAEGYQTSAIARFSHAEGYGTLAGIPDPTTRPDKIIIKDGQTYIEKNFDIDQAAHVEGIQTSALGRASHAAGIKAVASNNYSYVWNGISSTTYNPRKGDGTYCINPKTGASGFYIGSQNLTSIISQKVNNTLEDYLPISGGSIIGNLSVENANVKLLSGNYIQTSTPDDITVYGNNSYVHAESNKYGKASVGSNGFYIVGVISADNKLMLSTNGTSISDIIPASCCSNEWSIALSSTLDSQFSQISTIGDDYIVFKNLFNNAINSMNGKELAYFESLIANDDNALYCPSHPDIGNIVLTSFQYCHVEGGGTHAIAQYAHAEGRATIAEGRYSHAEGGNGTTAGGVASHAEGFGSKSFGNRSHAEGSDTCAAAWASHAEGDGTQALGSRSHAEGLSSIASGEASHSEGKYAKAAADSAHAEGYQTYALASYTHSEGYQTSALNNVAAHAEGANTYAAGNSSHAEGFHTSALSQASHAEGCYSWATGNGSHAEGGGASSNLPGGKATGTGSHAEGYNTLAQGNWSHAEGSACSAIGIASHASGQKSKALKNRQFVWNGVDSVYEANGDVGTFNINPTNGISNFYIGKDNFIQCVLSAVSLMDSAQLDKFKQILGIS